MERLQTRDEHTDAYEHHQRVSRRILRATRAVEELRKHDMLHRRANPELPRDGARKEGCDCEGRPREEEVKEAMRSDADAVVDPDAVVVHAVDASATTPAVVRARAPRRPALVAALFRARHRGCRGREARVARDAQRVAPEPVHNEEEVHREVDPSEREMSQCKPLLVFFLVFHWSSFL